MVRGGRNQRPEKDRLKLAKQSLPNKLWDRLPRSPHNEAWRARRKRGPGHNKRISL